MDIPRLESIQIIEAIESALKQVDSDGKNLTPQKLHRSRSKLWVKHFALELKRQYHDENIVAFYRDKSSREILFDISIGYNDEFDTNKTKVPINYIKIPLWQIESEFVLNASKVAFDFTKLIVGSAPFKMMIGSISTQKRDSEYFMNAVKEIAKYIEAKELYYLLLSHPNSWNNVKEIEFSLYKWSSVKWREEKK